MMVETSPKVLFEERVSKQVYDLSEIIESVSIRLVELENKLSELEKSMPSLIANPKDPSGEIASKFLNESREKFDNIESILKYKKNVEEENIENQTEVISEDKSVSENIINSEEIIETEYVDNETSEYLSA